ncbi:hypothetical protein A3A70_00075 [candidate division WWE3 bacterium RIFCSPLOWO2_01_FULL_42_11]|uniref:Aspartyl/glutamyl-tRNA(Asn/Gln) amidotransferase subunit C n=1 Tax=candidate division WWE3 bacterium RIFCSPLOWO2_01_FULL_42_11 TaxID=1802627 RepID=A0A1F4VRP1_UNCKA|nr:MAG: hypothetical protein A3A70_00075 [candidate division WWE3 bacterium RIFCSPLOWO2_01_FULL_42_11]
MNDLNLKNLSILAKLDPDVSLDESEFIKIIEFINSLKQVNGIQLDVSEARTNLRPDSAQPSLNNLDQLKFHKLNKNNYFELTAN